MLTYEFKTVSLFSHVQTRSPVWESKLVCLILKNVTAHAWAVFHLVKIKSEVYFDVLLTVLHLSIFISVFNQLDAQNFFHSKFYFVPLHVSSTCALVSSGGQNSITQPLVSSEL